MTLRNSFIIFTLTAAILGGSAQDRKEKKLLNSAFEHAIIEYSSNQYPRDIRFINMSVLDENNFFTAYRNTFNMGAENEFRPTHSSHDDIGFTHIRHKQFYKGIELAETQYLLHSRNGELVHTHGNIIHALDLNTSPGLSAEQASRYLKKHVGESAIFYKKEKSTHPAVNVLPVELANKPRLMLSAGNKPKIADNFKLVYRFDVITTRPTGRYWVDIDANTGELVGKIATAYSENIQTTGESLYYGNVDITVSDSSYTDDWELPSRWYTDNWEAYGGTGTSWRIADPDLGTNGGYGNEWYDVLQTEPIVLLGDNPELSFVHRYALEEPEKYEEYDGWDGINVRISTDGGTSWDILVDPSIAYNCDSLFSFGFSHNEGIGIPGWGGEQQEWTEVSFDLTEYAGHTVQIRFAFASDPGYSTSDGAPELFGWQIDNIIVSGAGGTLFQNSGTPENMEMLNIFKFVTIIEGNYRLRETTRGNGIATLNALSGEETLESVDFVEDDPVFNEEVNKTGVGLHWATAKTYDYFAEKHNRHSFDDNDAQILVYSDWVFTDIFGTSPNNAMWAGEKAFFGAGDGNNYGSHTSLDIVGHELAHGVTQFSAGLIYQNEPGALNESFSDIFGAAVEFYADAANADWILGEDIVINGSPIRSMSSPKDFGDPDTYEGIFWIESTDVPNNENDYGGVHHNSGVQNYWFYLLSEGGSGTNDDGFAYNVSGIGVEDAAAIAYRNLTSYLTPISNFQAAAYYAIQSAKDLFGEQAVQVSETLKAWEAVGIYQEPSVKAPNFIEVFTQPFSSTSKTVEIRNKGLQNLVITGISIEGEGFSLDQIHTPPYEIDFDQVFSFSFSFSSIRKTEKTGKIRLQTNDPDFPVFEIALSGNTSWVLDIDNAFTDESSSPTIFENYPNPFRNNTVIPFHIPEAGRVKISVFNSIGETVYFFEDQFLAAGEHAVEWNASNNSGNRVPPGMYIVVLETKYGKSSKKISTL